MRTHLEISGAPFASGSFVSTWVGFTTSPTTTWFWSTVGGLVTLRAFGTVSATSNATGFLGGAGEVPAQIRPTPGLTRNLWSVTDNGVAVLGYVTVTNAGTISFLASVASGAFTASGLKGFVGGQVVTYPLN